MEGRQSNQESYISKKRTELLGDLFREYGQFLEPHGGRIPLDKIDITNIVDKTISAFENRWSSDPTSSDVSIEQPSESQGENNGEDF